MKNPDIYSISLIMHEDIKESNGLLDEDIDYIEPEAEFTYGNQKYPTWGLATGRSRTTIYDTGKFNRYAKLGNMADSLMTSLINIVNEEYDSIRGRCAYASILMMEYGVRIGNEDSAEGYVSGMKDTEGQLVHTYGTTTLLNKHITFSKDVMKLHFLGKEQVEHNIYITHPILLKYGKYYHDTSTLDDKWLKIEYDTLFKFVKNEIGPSFVPKDLRTFCGNITGWKAILGFLGKPKHTKISDAKKEVKKIVEIVSNKLGNTPGIAKRSYLDARMLDWFLGQRLHDKE